ncbi:MAG: hypothetical protein K6E13_05125 [Lachnospiraceae bacterium]|nr:hypothetical protein [Lachnospiraceae bacterium]
MKDMTMYNIGFNETNDTEPEWMKEERYEYCEDFIDKFKMTPLTDLANALKAFMSKGKAVI